MDKTLAQNNIQDNFLNQARRERVDIDFPLGKVVRVGGGMPQLSSMQSSPAWSC